MSAKLNEDDFEDDLIDVSSTGADDDIDIEVEDDTPEEDRGKPVAAADSQDEDEDDNEMSDYGDKVQARFRKMTAQKHDERRAKEGALRERDAALGHAQRAQAEVIALRQQLTQAAQTTIGATKAQATQEVDALKNKLRDAVELGDGEKVAELTAELQKANYRLMSAESAEINLKNAPQQQQQTEQRPVRPQVSDKQRQWVSANPWFESNPRMAAYAMAVHGELYEKGVAMESDLYYNTIDKEMRERFPEEFKSSKQTKMRTSGPPVAGVTRQQAGKPGKQTVKLTESEVAIAKQLGISTQEYARQKLKMGADR